MTSVLPLRPGVNGAGAGASSNHTRDPSNARSESISSNRDGSLHESPQKNGAKSLNSHSRTPSTQSSIPPPQKTSRSGRRPAPLKSQYPANSAENHVEYILVASFDVDRGSIMEHQYPGPISGDEHMLAELMLPDQTHMRSQDWTIFFLHKDTAAEDEAREERRERRRQRRKRREARNKGLPETSGEVGEDIDVEGSVDSEEDDDDEDEEEIDGPPLIYVLNLVNTKLDTKVKRGSVVKSMAICTRHSFLHIYKPLLLLALETYFQTPTQETLASLFDAVNSMDLSLMPKLSYFERSILQSSDAKDMFVEKFEQMVQRRRAEDVVRQQLSPLGSDGKPSKRLTIPRDTHEFESKVQYNGVPVPIKVPTAIAPETVGDFSLIKLITTFASGHSRSPEPFPTHPHLTTSGPLTHPIIVLLNALLTQKRVIFLGHNRPSGEVAEAVLAACSLASGGILRGFTRHAFPYTDLTKIDDLLKVPGFVAGVTNPAFAHKPEWWDLLCDLPAGKMKISPKIEPAPITEGIQFFQQQQAGLGNGRGGSDMSTSGISGVMGMSVPGLGSHSNANSNADYAGDANFMESVMHSINSRYGEAAIRSKFRAYVAKFTRLAAAFEESVFGASAIYIGVRNPPAGESTTSPSATSPSTSSNSPIAGPNGLLDPQLAGHGYVWPSEEARVRELAANIHRIEGWRNTRSYYAFISDHAMIYTRRPIKDLDLLHLHDRLRSLKLGADATAPIYLALANRVRTYDEICQLLATVAESSDIGASGGGSGGGGGGGGAGGGAVTNYGGGKAGLFWIGLGLFHQRADVREGVVELLERIREHEAGRHFWAGLGRFAKLAFFRIKRDRESGDVGR
ncbi:MAG: hypothetical protein M1822_000539 [Bathelium mastoideum]|nr:MAG: hypothetical protein M1822_000539 [Bathelium mastoideum]